MAQDSLQAAPDALRRSPRRSPPPAMLPRSTPHPILNSIRLQHNNLHSTASVSNTAPSTQQHAAARDNP
eukprot:9294130-Pyramimonas_sp.AAC.1